MEDALLNVLLKTVNTFTMFGSRFERNHPPVAKATVHHGLQERHLLLGGPSRVQHRKIGCLQYVKRETVKLLLVCLVVYASECCECEKSPTMISYL